MATQKLMHASRRHSNSLRRSTLIVFLNKTNEELILVTNPHQPSKGVWSAEKYPPVRILAGESGLWQSKSSKLGRGTVGSTAFRIAGDPDQDVVTVSWQNPFFGQNTYRGTVTQKDFNLVIYGVGGSHAIVVFVLRT
jgi:hypothetical protein